MSQNVHDLTRSGTRRTPHVSIAEVATVQELHHALQIGVAQPARDLRRGHPDLRELGVGEGEHVIPSKSGARALPVVDAGARPHALGRTPARASAARPRPK